MKYEKFKKINIIEIPEGYLVWRYGTADNIELFDIEVNPQRQGYGKKLLKMLINEIEDGNKIIFGFTKRNNFVAQSFYVKYGFNLCPVMFDEMIFWQRVDVLKSFLKNEENK